MTMEELKEDYNYLRPQAAEEILNFINSLPEMKTLGIQVEYTWDNFNQNLDYDFSTQTTLPTTRFTISPKVEDNFGSDLDLTCSPKAFTMNYGSCGTQDLQNNQAFIQKNLLIGIITLHQKEIQNHILNLFSIQEMNHILEKKNKLNFQEYQEKAEKEKKAKEEAEAQKLAEKKAKAAERRKARRLAKKAAQN